MKKFCMMLFLTAMISVFIPNSAMAGGFGNSVLPGPHHFFLAVQPAITVEPFDNKSDTFDVNILPLIVEFPLTESLGMRFNPIVNLQFTPGQEAGISHTGVGVSLPFYSRQKRTEVPRYVGFFYGPHTGLTYNFLDEHYSLFSRRCGLWLSFRRTVGVKHMFSGRRYVFHLSGRKSRSPCAS